MLSSDASDELLQLRTELAVARDLAEKAQANALNAEAEAARVRAINADLLARNAHLELMNEKMRRDKYGASSERSRRLIDQLELTFEELEADAAEAESLGAIAAAKATTVTAFTRVRSTRRDFDPGLPREQIVIPAPELCPCCGSADLSHLPADITETLEKVPARHKVIQTVREKVSWADKPMTRANCWAHARRQFFELADVARQLKRQKGGVPLVSPLAKEALEWIDQIFAIEREINGRTAGERLSVRQERVAPLIHALETWMREKRGILSRHDAVAKAIAYLLNDWAGFTTFLADGRICLTNNAAERELRSVARGRKAWLFVGSDRGGERAAMMYSLIGTARLNGVDPLAWLTDVLVRIADLPQSRLHELLPWEWIRLRKTPLVQEAA